MKKIIYVIKKKILGLVFNTKIRSQDNFLKVIFKIQCTINIQFWKNKTPTSCTVTYTYVQYNFCKRDPNISKYNVTQ